MVVDSEQAIDSFFTSVGFGGFVFCVLVLGWLVLVSHLLGLDRRKEPNGVELAEFFLRTL
jgi:hypothetical protein